MQPDGAADIVIFSLYLEPPTEGLNGRRVCKLFAIMYAVCLVCLREVSALIII